MSWLSSRTALISVSGSSEPRFTKTVGIQRRLTPEQRELLGTLADYGIEDVYDDAAALATRGLDACSLELAATPAHESTLRELFTTHQRVITV